jgi:hypothetical protein
MIKKLKKISLKKFSTNYLVKGTVFAVSHPVFINLKNSDNERINQSRRTGDANPLEIGESICKRPD